ncbi:MAG: DNA translocase FtsK 4TM domain-containing protein [Fermentimonas sp.]|jgi:S-DNA-T family DNA segregation ATPase FtsK/SpoIIIE
MAKRTKKRNTTGNKGESALLRFFRSERTRFILGVIVAFTGIFMLIAIISFFFTGAADQSKVTNISFWDLVRSSTNKPDNWTGAGGAFIAERLVNKGFGIFSMLIPMFFIYVGLRLMKVSHFSLLKALFVTAFGLIGGSIASAFLLNKIFPNSHVVWGGAHGNEIEQFLNSTIGWPGTLLVVILFIIIIAVFLRKSSIYTIQKTLVENKPSFIRDEDTENEPVEKKPNIFQKASSSIKNMFSSINRHRKDDIEEVAYDNSVDETKNHTPEVDTTPQPITERVEVVKNEGDFEIIIPKDDEVQGTSAMPKGQSVAQEDNITKENYDPRKDLSQFKFPPLSLLKVYDQGNREINMAEQNENKDRIINTLKNYGIEITSIKATVGPTITLYEIVPQAGVRISKIRNLEDDIALSLSALGIRIIAPMPGKGTIGIEVPNKNSQIVSMHSVLSSKKYQECKYALPVALGKTITNEVFIFDLAKMPHLLVAGATGQGKSVGLNAIITSLLYSKHPSEMKMVLIDPKMVEFSIYRHIENHYLAKLEDEASPIITDVTKVTKTLNSLTKEMDDRYELLVKAQVRDIADYNKKFIERRLNPNNGHRFLPYIVVVIDEFGDLIMTAGKEIEMPIARIAQKARAVGMHMIIATQRPTTNIITGTIKANFPARMAFRVTSQIDSRTILDVAGANQLIGRGDMLFSQGSILTRIQCAFVDTPELDEITKYIAVQQGYESAYLLPEVVEDGDSASGVTDLSDRDALFDEAARLIVVHQQGSTSLIQRKFSIGYNRAGRLMDQLEAAGIVGPIQGSKPREVYIKDEYSLERILNDLN